MPRTRYKKRADGRYYTSVWDGTYKPDGKRNLVHLYAATSAELERKVGKVRAQLDTGQYVRNSDTLFGEYAQTWLKTYKSVREKGTQAMYRNIINVHLAEIAYIKLSEIRKSDIQGIINERQEHYRTCEQIRLTVSQIMRAAEDDRLITDGKRREVCERIQLPAKPRREKRALTEQEKAAIKAADFTDRERTFVYLIYACGLRRGEALALTWTDVDLEAGEISINKAVAFDKNDPYLKCPKSRKSTRRVPIPAWLSTYLQQQRANICGLNLIAGRSGGLLTHSGYAKMWESIRRKMNQAAGGTEAIEVIHDLTAHVFRHNYCTQLIYAGMSIKKVAELLGDSEKMVTEVYSHILEEKESTEEKIEAAVAL